MASEAAVVQGDLLKRQKIVNFAYTAPPAIQIQYIGSKLYCKAAVASGIITIKADDTDGATTTYATIDATAASGDTFGELCDLINAYADLRAFAIGEINTATSNTRLADLSATSIRTTNGLTLESAESVSGYIVGFAITNEKFTSRPTGGFSTKYVGWTTNANCINSLNYLNFSLTTTGNGTYQVYSVSGSGAGDVVSTMIPATAFTSATTTTIAGAVPSTPYISANVGERLVVTFDGAAAITAGNVYAVGQTKNIVGDVVPSGNYTGCV